MKQFKIRSSAIGDIMGNHERITLKQLEELNTLSDKTKLTDKQAEKLDGLRLKRDTPSPLSAGAKTYCENWLKSQLYNRRKVIHSKYLTKGLEVESDSIDFASDKLGWGLVFKNETYKENDFITGTADLLLKNRVVDIKNAYDWSTFPLFETTPPDSANAWQLLGYMDLYKKDEGQIVYTLMDLPEDLLESEVTKAAYQLRTDELPKGFTESVIRNFVYDDVSDNLRIKAFEPILFDQSKIEAVYERVELCRNYIKSLLTQINK